jgi:hypothetical protein
MPNANPETLTVLIPHHLGQDEAVRRIKGGLDHVEQQFRSVFQVQEQTWTGSTLQFKVRAIGQSISGTIDVQDRQVKLDIVLPWIIARLAAAIRRVAQSQGTKLLEKK